MQNQKEKNSQACKYHNHVLGRFVAKARQRKKSSAWTLPHSTFFGHYWDRHCFWVAAFSAKREFGGHGKHAEFLRLPFLIFVRISHLRNSQVKSFKQNLTSMNRHHSFCTTPHIRDRFFPVGRHGYFQKKCLPKRI